MMNSFNNSETDGSSRDPVPPRQIEDSYSVTLLDLPPRRHLGGPPGPSQGDDGDRKDVN